VSDEQAETGVIRSRRDAPPDDGRQLQPFPELLPGRE